MTDVLNVVGVSRAFGPRVALADVSFDVRPGRMTGLVGAPGAGATTAMRIIMGVLAPDTGRVELGGRPLTSAERTRFGYLPQERGMYPRMRVADQLIYLGRVHGLDVATARRRTTVLLEGLGLADHAQDTFRTLPSGSRQRVGVAAALVHDPTVLVLDGPFAGLDRHAADALGEQLRERAAGGASVIFSAHQLDLVEHLCDDVVLLSGGHVVAAGEASALRAGRTGRRIRLRVQRDLGPPDPSAVLRGLRGVALHEQVGDLMVVDLSEDADDQALLRAAARHGAVREFAPVAPALAEIFREVTS